MRQRQVSNFQRTRQAMGSLMSMGITSVHKAAAAITEDPSNTGKIELIKRAYGTTPEVKNALSRKS